MKLIHFIRNTLPLLQSTEFTIVGGSFAGISAALELARAGRSVVLVEPRTYLGWEITATLRPWVPALPSGEYPELIAACIETSGTHARQGEYPLHPDAIKTCLEDRLLAAGVQLVYASQPVGFSRHGLIIGNKSGRQVIECQAVLDCTPTAQVVRLSAGTFSLMNSPVGSKPEMGLYAITLEFEGVAFQEEGEVVQNVREWEIPAQLSAVIRQANTHRGYRSDLHGYRHGHNLIEVILELPQAKTALELSNCYLAARRYALDFASYLLWENHFFRLAYLGSISQEVLSLQAKLVHEPSPSWAQPLDAVQILDMAPLSRFAAPAKGLFCLNEVARVDVAWFRDPLRASRLGAAVGRALQSWREKLDVDDYSKTGAVYAGGTEPSTLEIREPESPQRGRYLQVPAISQPVPIFAEADVLVVGGGTSGAIAAITAAQSGVRTLIVEMNPGLGGTATYGGVHNYWGGYQYGFAKQSIAWVNRIHDQIRFPRTYGIVGEWNIEAKIQALAEQARCAGAEMLFNASVIGAIVDGKVVRGVLAATPFGPVALLGKVVIDATGDGDVAAFAGAEFTYGSQRDHAVMWYSLPQFSSPGYSQNNFTSMVDVSNIQDYTRAVLSGRRRGGEVEGGIKSPAQQPSPKNQLLDHGSYVAPRESRHIVGDVVQTLTDQLRQRCWPDVINVAVGNNDIKGQVSSDWMRAGLIPPNLMIENSYRMLLPRGLDGILVVGKAISASREALASIRMQPDLENLGGAAGLAAAMAVQAGISLREVDIRALQQRLVAIGALPDKILDRRLVPVIYRDDELEEFIVKLLADERPWREYSNTALDYVNRERIPLVEIVTAGERAIPLLKQALVHAGGSAKVRAAQALALMGCDEGVDVLISVLSSQLVEPRLPQREAFVQHAVKYAPDQAAMPDPAYELYTLGMARTRRALPIWQRVVDLLASVSEEDIWSQNQGIFAYVDAVCLGAERLGDPEAVPILKQLHGYPAFQGKQLAQGIQADYLRERLAYLEVVIGRALARCASPDGVVVLMNYLTDVRSLLAEQAHDELVAISGQDFGKNPAAWGQWLEVEGDRLKPVPWDAPLDPVAAWGETVLTVETV